MKKTIRKRVKGSHKGVWLQEATNVPVASLKKIPGSYYFFDYYLSGASWSGSVGFEDITLH